MRKIFLFLLFVCFLNLAGFCQEKEVILRGQITLQNSGSRPVEGVQISAPGINPTMSDNSGQFEMKFIAIHPGDRLVLTVKKQGLEVVSPADLEVVLSENTDDPVQVALCIEGERHKQYLAYHEIIRQAINSNHDERLKEVEKITGDIEKKNKIVAQLQAWKDAAESQAKKMAERFSLVNLDKVSQLYKDALVQFREGNTGKTLEILEDKKIADALDNARKETQEPTIALNQAAANYILKARLLTISFQFDEAENDYRKALDAAPGNFENHLEFVYYLNEQNRRTKFLPLYEKSLALAKTGNQKARLLIILGHWYCVSKQYKTALQSYQDALEIFEKLAQENPQLFEPGAAQTRTFLAEVYQKIKQFSKALPFYKKNLEVYEKLANENKKLYLPKLAQTQDTLGKLYLKDKQFYDARSCYQKNLEIYEKLALENPKEYLPKAADSFYYMGMFNKALKQYNDAITYYKKASEIYKKLADENSKDYLPKTVNALSGLGESFDEANQFSEAVPAYIEALEIARSLAKEDPQVYLPGLVKPLYKLGRLYYKTLQFNEALPIYKEALEVVRKLAEETPQDHSSFIALLLDHLGFAHFKMNQFKESLSYYTEALQIYEKLSQEDPKKFDFSICRIIVSMCHSYARLLEKEPQKLLKDRAFALVKQALTILKKYSLSPKGKKLLDSAIYWKKYFKKVPIK